MRGLISSGPHFPAPGLTVHATIALSKKSVLWKHTSRYISFEEITRSLMKYAKNMKGGAGEGVDMTAQRRTC